TLEDKHSISKYYVQKNIITVILSEAESENPVTLSFGIATGFLDFARNDGTRSLSSPPLLFANQRYHHALNLELAGRDQIRVARVFRFEIWPAVLDHVTLQ